MSRSTGVLAAAGASIVAAGAVALTLLTAGPAAATTLSTSVTAAASGGVATVSVTQGDAISVTASGSAGYGYEGASDCTGYPQTDPNGNRWLVVNGVKQVCQPKYGSDNKLSTAPVGELIARIGAGAWFVVGSSGSFTASATGTLYLAYNDSIYGDNSGSYSATVTDNGGGVAPSPSKSLGGGICRRPPCPQGVTH